MKIRARNYVIMDAGERKEKEKKGRRKVKHSCRRRKLSANVKERYEPGILWAKRPPEVSPQNTVEHVRFCTRRGTTKSCTAALDPKSACVLNRDMREVEEA